MIINIDIDKKNNLTVNFPYNQELIDIIHELPSRQFNKIKKIWSIPLIDLPILRDSISEYVKKNNVDIYLSELAKKKYINLINEFKELKKISELQDIDYEIIGLKSNVKLYPFQKVAVKYLETAGRALLALDMGLGKSISSLAAASNLIHKNKIKKTLIICPASLKFNWAVEIAKFTDYSYKTIGGDKDYRKESYKNNSDFTIMNYDLLRLDLKYISKCKWDLIIADEIQRAKNYYTETSKSIKKLKSEYAFGLTGTPIENGLMDLFSVTRFVNPKIFGSNGLYFKERYHVLDGFGGIRSLREDRIHEINRKTSYFIMRRKKRDVLDNLPERITNNYYIELNKEERKLYNRYKQRAVDSDNILEQFVYLREICDCYNLVEDNEKVISSKLTELKRIIEEDLPSDAKIIIFTEYERMALILENELKYKSVHLHGGVKSDCKLEKEIEKSIKKEFVNLSEKEIDLKINEERKKAICKTCPYYNNDEICHTRKKIISKFNNEEEYKLLISTNAGKEGLNLQPASVVVNYDKSFNPAVNEQRIGRIERIGQEAEKIFVINLICEDTLEERVEKKNEEKQDLFDKIIDRSDKAILKIFTREQLLEML